MFCLLVLFNAVLRWVKSLDTACFEKKEWRAEAGHGPKVRSRLLPYVPLGHAVRPTWAVTNSKHWFTTTFLQPLPYRSIGPRKLSANEQFFVGAQTVSGKFVTNNSNIRCLFYIAILFTPAQIKQKSFESKRNFFSFFLTLGGCVSCLRACLGARLLHPETYQHSEHRFPAPSSKGRKGVVNQCLEFESYQYPILSEGADRVGGQLRGDKECLFSGITKSGRVWRKVPESDDRRSVRAWPPVLTSWHLLITTLRPLAIAKQPDATIRW